MFSILFTVPPNAYGMPLLGCPLPLPRYYHHQGFLIRSPLHNWNKLLEQKPSGSTDLHALRDVWKWKICFIFLSALFRPEHLSSDFYKRSMMLSNMTVLLFSTSPSRTNAYGTSLICVAFLIANFVRTVLTFVWCFNGTLVLHTVNGVAILPLVFWQNSYPAILPLPLVAE